MLFRLVFVVSLLVSISLGQGPVIDISGDVWDGNGGPFVSGQVYRLRSTPGSNTPRVPAGRTLTVQAGAIVKIDVGLVVDGDLQAADSVFTSWRDDNEGGDSNGDGTSTVPAAGDWDRIELRSGSRVDLLRCRFLYGGSQATPGAAVFVRGGETVLRECLVRYSDTDGINCGKNRVVVDHCRIEDCGDIAVFGAVLQDLDAFASNSAARNARGDYIYCTVANKTTGGRRVLNPINTLNTSGVVVLGPEAFSSIDLIVQPGDELLVQPGMIFKWVRGRCFVYGSLQCAGTAANNVVFTSFEDDVHGGGHSEGRQCDSAAAGRLGGYRSELPVGGRDFARDDYLHQGLVRRFGAECRDGCSGCRQRDEPLAL